MNRGVEIARRGRPSCPRSVIIEQVANGVAVRMAVLFRLLGSGERSRDGDASVSRIVIRGGTVRRRDGRAPRRRRRRATAGSSRSGPTSTATTCSTPAAAWSPPASSTSTPTCASPATRRPRRSRPAAAPPRSAGTPRSWPCPTPSRPSTRAVVEFVRCSELGRAGLCDVQPAGCHHRRPRRRAAGARSARWPPLGVRLFTDDGTGVQDPALMRRALEYAGGLGIDAGPALRGRRARPRARCMHEGAWSQPPRPARLAGRGRGADGAPRHRAGPPHRRPRPLPAPVDGRQRRAGARREGGRAAGHRRGRAAPLHPHRRRAAPATTRCSRSTRRCAPPPTSRRQGRAGRRHDRRHRHRPRPAPARGEGAPRSTRRRPACSASRPRSALALTELDMPLTMSSPRWRRWKPGGDRRRRNLDGRVVGHARRCRRRCRRTTVSRFVTTARQRHRRPLFGSHALCSSGTDPQSLQRSEASKRAGPQRNDTHDVPQDDYRCADKVTRTRVLLPARPSYASSINESSRRMRE